MKKMITLLLSISAFTTSFAQYGQGPDKDYWHGGNGVYASSSYEHNRNDRKFYDNRNFFSARERDFQIDKINREFNFKVMLIQNDRYMRRHEKKVAIRNAEYERARQIQMVNMRFKKQYHKGHDNGRRW